MPKLQSQIIKNISVLMLIALAIFLPVCHVYCGELLGQAAPDFSLKSINGGTISLSSYRGKVVLLNFWATWCAPCKEEMPSMNMLYHKYKNNGLVVLAASTDNSAAAVERFVSRHHLAFPVLLDSDMKVAKAKYRINAQPTTFLIGKDGTVINKYFGSVNWMDETIQKEIAALF
ncbi:MAG: TlpA family protein disulfide reductase [Nitrospirae bacterium]|nr:TlpA family protein disulfide reductase [Nitrospirota bacterium]